MCVCLSVCVIWVKDAPKVGVDDDIKVCTFIDQYISCAIPKQEGKLKSYFCYYNNTNIPHIAKETINAVSVFLDPLALTH